MTNVRVSAVALIDVLGFKNIETRHDATDAAAALTAARNTAVSMAELATKSAMLHRAVLGGPAAVKTAWFSDTILIVSQLRQPDRSDIDPKNRLVQSCLVNITTLCAAYLVRKAASSAVPLTFRGTIAIGDLIVEGDNIFFGPAIVEAAESHERANGAFVWLTPEAASLPEVLFESSYRPAVEYPVPMKDSHSIKTLVVNPFIDMSSTGAPGQEVRRGIERAMAGDRSDIALKRRNTLLFLDHVAQTESTALDARQLRGR